MKDITKKYTNGEVTVVWKPNQCIHSTICFNGLSSVFDPQKRPWVTPEGGTTQQIIDQIKKCPSGALSYFKNDEAGSES
ncbi:MAG: (4Fe-4S)-binding protein [Cytophagales bacterium]|nr:(4Fe-4S)-binding protein [Cytophagales bacterium]